MNFQIIKRTLGWILMFEALFFVLPVVTAMIYSEIEVFTFLICMSLCIAVGILFLIEKPKNTTLYAKEGFIVVALSWIIMSIVGALPFYLSETIPSYIDALFETVSGFTTTGATILSSEIIETMPKSLLIWRSFTHWIGGMGVLVFIMAMLPLSGARNMYIMQAESPGPTVSKLVPKVRKTAIILYVIYAGMTAIQTIMLLFGDMTLFEAINTALSTAGTGGFGVKGDSMSGYSSYIQIVVTVFMILFSINFNSYYLILRGKIKDAFNTEVCIFLGIVIVAIIVITLNLCFTESNNYDYSVGESIKHSAFNVASVISTTGFITENFDFWPALSKIILVTLMFIGACAGSTGGGIKVSRIVILFKGMAHELKRMIHPKQVKKISMDKRPVENEVVRTVNAYIIAYIMIFIVSMLIIAIDCQDLVTNFTSVAATINNVGPGLNLTGPAGNFAFFSNISKIVFIFDMLAGRLEVFPMLLLFTPTTWKKS